MTVDCVSEGRTLTAAVRGELDHHRAKEVMTELDEQIDMALPRRLTLDLSGLSFTDSSAEGADQGRADSAGRASAAVEGVSGGRPAQADPI